MRGRLIDLSIGFNGKQRLLLELDGDFKNDFDTLHTSDVEISVKKFRHKRSLDANGYAWVLIDKIAALMKMNKLEVYKDHIRGLGGVSQTVCVQDYAAAKLIENWCKNGLGWQAETFKSKIDGCVNVTLYYGSSTYDTEQMSSLINSLVDTAKSLGIETMPPEELNSLVGAYDRPN